jgi:hypothetical protein
MTRFGWRRRLIAPAALAALAAGCNTAPPGAGFVNPTSEVISEDKAAVRSDLPVADPNPKGIDPILDAAPAKPASTGSDSGGAAGGTKPADKPNEGRAGAQEKQNPK